MLGGDNDGDGDGEYAAGKDSHRQSNAKTYIQPNKITQHDIMLK